MYEDTALLESKPLFVDLMGGLIRNAELEWGLEGDAVLKQKRRITEDLYYLGRNILDNSWLGGIHKQLSDQMMAPGWEKALVLVPRDHLKTTFCNATYVLQSILRNFDVRILIGSETAEKAESFLRIVKNALLHPSIADLYGDLQGGKWTDKEIVVSRRRNPNIKEPTVDTCGIGGLKTGMHYDLIVFDDLVNQANIATPAMIQKVINFYQQSLPQLDPNGKMVVIGTRWHKKDLYGYILKNLQKHFQLIIVRQVIENGKIIYPERFKQKKIDALKDEMGGYRFACQYRNEPLDVDKEDFKEEWFKYYDRLSNKSAYNCYITVDPAISRLKGRHNTGIIVAVMDHNGFVMVEEAIRGKFSPKMTVDIVLERAKRYMEKENIRDVEIGIEGIGFQEMLIDEVDRAMREKNVFYPITELKPKQFSKIERIRALQPRYQRGNIWHRRGMCDALEEELLWLGEGSHPDVADAMAYQIKMWHTPYLEGQDPNKSDMALFYEKCISGGASESSDWYENPSGN